MGFLQAKGKPRSGMGGWKLLREHQEQSGDLWRQVGREAQSWGLCNSQGLRFHSQDSGKPLEGQGLSEITVSDFIFIIIIIFLKDNVWWLSRTDFRERVSKLRHGKVRPSKLLLLPMKTLGSRSHPRGHRSSLAPSHCGTRLKETSLTGHGGLAPPQKTPGTQPHPRSCFRSHP